MHWFCLHWKEKKTVMSVSYSAQLREHIILISWHGSDIVEYVLICCWCYLAFQRMSFDSNVILKDRSHPWIAMRFHFFCHCVSWSIERSYVQYERIKMLRYLNENFVYVKWNGRCVWTLFVFRLSQAQLFFLFSFLFITLYRYAVRSIHGGKWLFGIARQK